MSGNTPRISKQTYLGNCLEEVAGQAVKSLPWQFERSPDPPEGMISPDFIRLKDPSVFIAVTSTPTRNTFQKKKWRYIHEVFSLKQYHFPRPLAINLNLTLPGAVQPNDKKILYWLYDIEIELPIQSLTPLLTLLDSEYENSGGKASIALDRIANHSALLDARNWLTSTIEEFLRQGSMESADSRQLWDVVVKSKKMESGRVLPNIKLQNVATTLRGLCFGCILIPDEHLKNTIDKFGSRKAVSKEVSIHLYKTEAAVIKTTAGCIASEEFLNTVNSFGTDLLVQTITTLKNADEIQHIARDLSDDNKFINNIEYVLSLLRPGRKQDFVKVVTEEFTAACDRKNPKRLEILDFALMCAGFSITETDKRLANEYGDLGAANRVQCMISAKCQGRFSFRPDESIKVASRIWDLICNESDIKTATNVDIISRVREVRLMTLKSLGVGCNPVEVLFEMLCNKHGFTLAKIDSESLLGDIGIGGRGAKVERLYIVKDAEHRAIVKVLSGHKGGFEHKSEELAARAWTLRYRQTQRSWQRNDFRLIFVHEGEWNEKALAMLLKAGWDAQIPLEAFVNTPRQQLQALVFGT